MVQLSQIRSQNAALKSSAQGLTAVVVGGTNGIGRAFLDELASNTVEPKVFIVGRAATVLSEITTALTKINSTGSYIPIQADDLTLLSNVEKAVEKIKPQADKIDLLFLSPGYLSFASRDESSEGLDKITAIRYYSRMRFVLDLLPLLNAAPSPRVVTVLGGGLEGAIFPDDMSLKDPKNYGVGNAANVGATYTTLFLEQLQKKNPKISFVHSFPGLVRTNLFNTEHFGAVFKFFVNWIVLPTIGRLLTVPASDSGARHLYLATSPSFAAEGVAEEGAAVGSNGKPKSGVYTTNEKTEAVHNDKVLKPYREDGTDKKIWDHTIAEYTRILG